MISVISSPQVDSDTLRKVWSDPMNGVIHCLVSNGDGTVIAVGHSTKLSIVTAKTICTYYIVDLHPPTLQVAYSHMVHRSASSRSPLTPRVG